MNKAHITSRLQRRAAAMIIGMALVLPAEAQFWNRSSDMPPDPVGFSNQMELGNLDQATAWLDAGLPVDFEGSRVGTGLMIGAWEGKIDLMQLFLSRGAALNALNRNGESALALAAWRGQMAAVQWLLAQGASVNAPPKHWSALHYAVFAGHTEIVHLLMEKGADINAQTTNGSSVLMMAVYEGREALAKLLIDKGANTKVKNDWDDGAMEWAMRFNHLGIAKLVGSAAEFTAAVSEPKEKWGEPRRSLRSSKELDELLAMREVLAQRKLSTVNIDNRIAAERVRIVRSEMAQGSKPVKAMALEITASKAAAGNTSAKMVNAAGSPGKAAATTSDQPKVFKAPPPTYFGTPKVPPAGKVKGY